jgi:DnaK suppressor protein
MTDPERNEIREKIELFLQKLEEDITELKDLTKPIPPENAYGRLSRLDAINNKSVNDAALRKNIKRKEKLDRALQRIEGSEFGICTRCKEPIPIARLMVMPEAMRCVKCASR